MSVGIVPSLSKLFFLFLLSNVAFCLLLAYLLLRVLKFSVLAEVMITSMSTTVFRAFTCSREVLVDSYLEIRYRVVMTLRLI